MKILLTVEEVKPGLEAWFNTNAGKLNDDFKKEGLFTKLYKQMPKVIRNKVPFDIILANKDKMQLLDSYSIKKIEGNRYLIEMVYNQNVIESFDVILMAIKAMPLRLQQMLESHLCKVEGTSLQNITKDALVRKTIHFIECGDDGSIDVKIINKEVFYDGNNN